MFECRNVQIPIISYLARTHCQWLRLGVAQARVALTERPRLKSRRLSDVARPIVVVECSGRPQTG